MRRGRLGLFALLALAGTLVLWLAARERPAGPVGAWMLRAGVTPRLAEAGGLQVRYVRRGSGPPLVLVHGIASSIYTWAEVIPALARTHDVIAVDLPGFGASDIPASFSADRYPHVLAAFLDGLGLPRVSLIGHSLGGAVACAFAAAHPARVERLVLVDAAGFNLAAEDRPWLLRLSAAPAAATLMEKLPLRRRLVTLGLRQVFHEDGRVTPEKVDEYAAPMSRPGASRFMSELLRGADDMGLPEAIGRIRAPTLVVWCAHDEWVPPNDADRFVEAIPGARKAIIEGCGHLPQEERPREFVAIVDEFL